MKTYIYIMAIIAAIIFAAVDASAQMSKRYYVNNGSQFNGIVSNAVVQNARGYGLYMEGGYYLAPMIAVGGFASFGTNNQYYGKETYYFEDGSALTTDVDRSIFQVPFGATFRYRFVRSQLQPYVEAKIGAEYSTQSTYLANFVNRHDNWGLYVSPEVGLVWFPFNKLDFGFQFSAYYSFATNRNVTYEMSGINNLGFKLGIAF